MSWKFLDKLVDEILNTMNGDTSYTMRVKPDGSFIRGTIQNAGRDDTVTKYKPRSVMYGDLRRYFEYVGAQADHLVFGDVRATRAAWAAAEDEQRKITTHIAADAPAILDGFEKSMRDVHRALEPWDGDLDIQDVTPQ